ncbi:hypothetical protein CUMW_280790 [Citrus unshiu]|uniref:Uncharacterized protein n=1 Tax=Citrus unshiu TaxID=55188 RepID=A0A2H5MV72_CITUN|nr:hypothetical protein CUMW_280790 [Citrus unshiu]
MINCDFFQVMPCVKYVDLSGTAIKWLPEELKFLINLKCFNLDGTICLRSIMKRLISSLCFLQVVRIFRCSSNFASAGIAFFGVPKCADLHLKQVVPVSMPSILVKYKVPQSFIFSKLIWDCKCLERFDVDLEGELIKIRKSHIFDSLHTVYIESCFEVKELTWLILASNLKNLST